MSTPEALPFDQPSVIHCVPASKGGSIQLNTPSARRPSADAYGIPDGVPEEVQRIVLENGSALKFSSQSFEAA
jgi:hypothetical protein